jgi:phosphoglycerate kinase
VEIGTLADAGKLTGTVMLRVDFNSPINPSSNQILDDKRFREHLPTVQALEDARLVVLTHQSRPGKKDFTTLEAHAAKLERLLGRTSRISSGGAPVRRSGTQSAETS